MIENFEISLHELPVVDHDLAHTLQSGSLDIHIRVVYHLHRDVLTTKSFGNPTTIRVEPGELSNIV